MTNLAPSVEARAHGVNDGLVQCSAVVSSVFTAVTARRRASSARVRRPGLNKSSDWMIDSQVDSLYGILNCTAESTTAKSAKEFGCCCYQQMNENMLQFYNHFQNRICMSKLHSLDDANLHIAHHSYISHCLVHCIKQSCRYETVLSLIALHLTCVRSD